jgi:hypothetical protein
MIKEALDRLSSFNLIHLETAMKIDIFIHERTPYQKSALERRQKDTVIENDDSPEFYFSSPEDIILNKLIWYKRGDQVSERQWLDVLGVIKVQENFLDKDYLIKWAQKLDIYNLLVDAFIEAEVPIQKI